MSITLSLTFLALAAFAVVVEVFAEQWLQVFLYVNKGIRQAVFLIDFSNLRLDPGGRVQGCQEIIGGQANKALLPREQGMVRLLEQPLPGIQSQHRVSNPCEVAFFPDIHGQRNGINCDSSKQIW